MNPLAPRTDPEAPADTATDPEALADAAARLLFQADRHYAKGDLAQAARCLDEAMPLKAQLGDQAGHAHLAQTLGFLRFSLRDHAGAMAAYEIALAYRLQVGDRRGQAVTLARLAEVHQHLGNHVEAVRLLNESLPLFSEPEHALELGTARNNLGISYYELGRVEEALSCYRDALEIRRRIGDREGLATTLLNLGIVQAEHGSPAQAAQTLLEAQQVFQAMGDKRGVCRIALRLGMLHQDVGDIASARRGFQTSLALANDPDVDSPDDRAAALYNLGELALSEAAPQEALSVLEEAEALLLASGLNAGLGMARQALGRTHLALGVHGSALTYLEQARIIQEAGNDSTRLSGTLVAIGCVLSACGRQSEAVDTLRRTLALQRQIGLHDDAIRTEQLLGRISPK